MSTLFPNQPNDPQNGPVPQTASVPFWDDPSTTLEPSNNWMSPWDVCLIGSHALPGVSLVKFKKHKRFDIKKVKGSTESTLTFTGYDPGEVVIVVKIWTQAHLNQLQAMMPVINQKPTQDPRTGKYSMQPIDVSHPSLTLLEIHSLLIDAVDGLEPSTPKGVWQMQIHCLEYKKPSGKDKTATATGSSNADYNDIDHQVAAAILVTPSMGADVNP